MLTALGFIVGIIVCYKLIKSYFANNPWGGLIIKPEYVIENHPGTHAFLVTLSIAFGVLLIIAGHPGLFMLYLVFLTLMLLIGWLCMRAMRLNRFCSNYDEVKALKRYYGMIKFDQYFKVVGGIAIRVAAGAAIGAIGNAVGNAMGNINVNVGTAPDLTTTTPDFSSSVSTVNVSDLTSAVSGGEGSTIGGVIADAGAIPTVDTLSPLDSVCSQISMIGNDANGFESVIYNATNQTYYDPSGHEIARIQGHELVDNMGTVMASYDPNTGNFLDPNGNAINIQKTGDTFTTITDVHGNGIEKINEELFDAKTHERIGDIHKA